MKHLIARIAALFIIVAGVAQAEIPDFARRITCEIDTPAADSLETMTWQQGTTPLMDLYVVRRGKPIATDTSVTARLIIGPSVTGTLFAVVTNYWSTNNSFLVQMPTIGTNSAAAPNGLWWYTVYFDRAGRVFWTGSGSLVIERTTSTDPDGLTWQAVGSGSWSDVVARASAAAAYIAGTNALAAAHSNDTGAALGLTALQAEADTLQSVAARGGFAGTEEITPLRVASAMFGASSGLGATGNGWGVFGALAGTSASGDGWGAYGFRAGSTSVGHGWGAYGQAAGRGVIGNYWGAYGGNAGENASGDNWCAFGNYAGVKGSGNNRLYIDVYIADPDVDGGTNDMIFGDNGTLSLGRSGPLTNPAPNVLRGNWTAPAAWETGSHASFMTNGQPIPAPSVYLLALDSSMWMDAGAWSTNGAAVKVSLGQYAGYPWAVCYSQWTNGQQGRVYAASIAAPAFDGARLSALRFLYRAFNTADNITVTIADAGSTNAFSTNTLTVTYTDSIHELVVPNLNRAAASGFTLQATVKVTAETADGSWTALPRVEALWSK